MSAPDGWVCVCVCAGGQSVTCLAWARLRALGRGRRLGERRRLSQTGTGFVSKKGAIRARRGSAQCYVGSRTRYRHLQAPTGTAAAPVRGPKVALIQAIQGPAKVPCATPPTPQPPLYQSPAAGSDARLYDVRPWTLAPLPH